MINIYLTEGMELICPHCKSDRVRLFFDQRYYFCCDCKMLLWQVRTSEEKGENQMNVKDAGQELIRPINRFEEDLAAVNVVEREEIVAVLRTFMAEVREVLEGSMRMVRLVSPEMEKRCATCAFNPKTDGLPGFAPTAYGLLHSIIEDNKVFLCHGDNPDWKNQHLIDPQKPVLCNGFSSVRLLSGTKTSEMALRTITAIKEIVPKK